MKKQKLLTAIRLQTGLKFGDTLQFSSFSLEYSHLLKLKLFLEGLILNLNLGRPYEHSYSRL